MKTTYPNYDKKMHSIKEKLDKEDKEKLEKYISDCSATAGKEKLEQRERYALQFKDVLEVSFKDFAAKDKSGVWDKSKINHLIKIIRAREDRTITGRNEAIKQLKYFLRWLYDDENLVKGIKTIKQPKGYNTQKINEHTLPTQEELKLIIQGAETIKDKAMLMLLMETGMRPIEILNLRWRDIKFIQE